MKRLINIKWVVLWIFVISFSLASSCKKDPPLPPVTQTEKGLILNFTGMFNGTSIEYKTGEYTRENGEIMRISNWAMIWSKVSLVKTNDSLVLLGDGYLYVDFVGGKTKVVYENAPAGDYKGISFQLGIDSAINHGDPTIWGATHPLNGSYTGLHWGWAQGYIFQALDGNFKANSGATTWSGMTLHTAGDGFTKAFFMPLSFSLSNSSRKTAQIEAWVDEFFKNPTTLSFAVDGASSHSVGSSEVILMNKILNNAGDVFRINEVK
jgi:hypothetical protein